MKDFTLTPNSKLWIMRSSRVPAASAGGGSAAAGLATLFGEAVLAIYRRSEGRGALGKSLTRARRASGLMPSLPMARISASYTGKVSPNALSSTVWPAASPVIVHPPAGLQRSVVPPCNFAAQRRSKTRDATKVINRPASRSAAPAGLCAGCQQKAQEVRPGCPSAGNARWSAATP